MNPSRRCPDCGTTIPVHAPAGQCPRCLLEAGLERETKPHQEPPGTARGSSATGFEPPSIGDLAQCFPQLEIQELLGTGGMGAVYRARQRALDRFVAVKILPPEAGGDQAFAERFSREARAMARLSHPNIVAVHDSGRAGEFYYFIMEYVDGVDLRRAMQAGELTPSKALLIVPQICDALQYAHDQGIVHRDIKPENILVNQRGQVKIADFGLAKLFGPAAAEEALTHTHQVMGTARYMAPEQMEGSHHVDHRADIYSLGVLFYELLTGQIPMGRFDPPSKIVRVDERLDDVVLRTLEREPDRRYQHASEVKTELESIREAKACPIPPVRTGPAVERLPHAGAGPARTQNRQVVPLILLVIMGILCLPLLTGAGLLGVYWFSSSERMARPEQPVSETATLIHRDDLLPSTSHSIAVIPFVSIDYPNEPSHHAFPHAQITEAFCEELTVTVQRQITQGTFPLTVKSESAKQPYSFTEQEAIAAGQALHARMVLTGVIHCEDSAGNVVPQDLAGTAKLALTIKLIDVPTGSLLLDSRWTDKTPSTEEERRAYVEETANKVAESVHRRLANDQR